MRQFGEPRQPPTLWQRIEQALVDAGHVAGHYHTGSGWSDYGDLEYRPPRTGYVIRRWAGSEPLDPAQYPCVDHAGRGRKDALPAYLTALRNAGIPCDVRLLNPWVGKKEVVVIWEDERKERERLVHERYAECVVLHHDR